MKLIIERECGDRTEVKSSTVGQIACFNRELEKHGLYIGGQEFD